MLNKFKEKNKKNNFKKIISTILLSFFIFNIFSINIVSAEEETSLCWAKKWKDRYDCQVKNYCEIYKKQWKNTFKWEDYFSNTKTWVENLFTKAKKLYRENQNSIYACWVIKLQENSYNLVQKKLVKQLDKTWILTSRITQKLELKVKKLKSIAKQKKCQISSNKEEWNSLQSKKDLLNESSYEYCKYSFYLDYLKNHYNNIQNANKDFLKAKKWDSFKIWQIAALQNKITQDIIDEENHSAKIFNLAFSTYIDYENNFPVHILLELIKEDFYVLRRKLHEAISPINQVVYKISNAMSF